MKTSIQSAMSILAAALLLASLSACTLQNAAGVTDTPPDEMMAQEDMPDTTTLGFKGIHLGMTTAQVDKVVEETAWAWPKKDMPDKATRLLEFEKGEPGEMIARLGCETGAVGAECYFVEKTALTFYEGKVAQITLFSPSVRINLESSNWSAAPIFEKILPWGRFVHTALVQRHGDPTTVYRPFSEVNIFAFKPGADNALYEWKLEGERILLGVGKTGLEHDCVLKYQNTEAMEAMAMDPGIRTEF